MGGITQISRRFTNPTWPGWVARGIGSSVGVQCYVALRQMNRRLSPETNRVTHRTLLYRVAHLAELIVPAFLDDLRL
jgi:hypothetical protein